MYQALDSFARVDTWHTSHPLDEQRFYLALRKIVRHPHFSADDIGEYLRQYFEIDRDADDYFSKKIDRLMVCASAVHDYLRYSGE